MNFECKLSNGDKVQDQVTGFEGIIIGVSRYINGCTQYGVRPRVDKDGKMVDAEWFDEDRLEVITTQALQLESSPTGGPQSEAPRL